jgi:hypothetical protein
MWSITSVSVDPFADSNSNPNLLKNETSVGPGSDADSPSLCSLGVESTEGLGVDNTMSYLPVRPVLS